MRLIVGADEVGRGAFAGPVVTAAVILSPDVEKAWNEDPKKLPVVIRDSKKMTALQRERSAQWIMDNAISFAFGEGSVETINNEGINSALQFAFRSSIEKSSQCHLGDINKLLIDAITVQDIDHFPTEKQEAIIRGDSLSCTIAAASIIAKVYRDELMKKLSDEENNSIYGWHSNKGYGTKDHRAAILTHGICRHHRTQFVNTSLSKAARL